MAYIDGASTGKAIAALYATSGGSASTLLEQTNSANIGTTMTWIDFQLTTPINVNSGTTYGLAIMGNVPVNIMENPGTGQRDHNAVSSYTAGFANPFGMIWGTDSNGAMSIYAVDPSSSNPTPTSTPTPTARPHEHLRRAQLQHRQQLQHLTSGNNLEPLSAFMQGNNVPIMPNGGNYASYDPSVTYNGNPSIQDTGNNPNNPEGEVDGAWIPVSPGDHIVISVWVKTSASTSTDLQSGATLGFYFLGDSNLGEAKVGFNVNSASR